MRTAASHRQCGIAAYLRPCAVLAAAAPLLLLVLTEDHFHAVDACHPHPAKAKETQQKSKNTLQSRLLCDALLRVMIRHAAELRSHHSGPCPASHAQSVNHTTEHSSTQQYQPGTEYQQHAHHFDV